MTTQTEALKLALEAFTIVRFCVPPAQRPTIERAITTTIEALAQPEQRYRRGDRLICLETEEYCVIHISGTDRQWVKFPDSRIGVYTNEQVAELFELLPKEPEQEPVAWLNRDSVDGLWYPNAFKTDNLEPSIPLYTTPPQRKPLMDEMVLAGARALAKRHADSCGLDFDDVWKFYADEHKDDARAVIEAANGIKGEA